MSELEPIYQAVGNRIRDLRLARGLTQNELNRRAGLSYGYIGYIERGQKRVTLPTLELVAQALGVPVLEVFRFQGVDNDQQF